MFSPSTIEDQEFLETIEQSAPAFVKPFRQPEFYPKNEFRLTDEKIEAVVALIRHYEKILSKCG